MLALVTIALATFTVIMAVRAALPFALPARLMAVAVTAAAYGMQQAQAHDRPVVVAAAAAGLVALVHKLAVGQDPEPWSLRELAARLAPAPRPKSRRREGPTGQRELAARLAPVPRTKSGKPKSGKREGPIGHRIPRL